MNSSSNPQQGVVAASTTTAMDASPSLQQRRIEFHLARKPSSSSFSNNNSNSNFKLEILNRSSASTSSQSPPSSNSKMSDSSECFDASFDLDFGFRIPCRRIGAGLENLGNTCFLNSVIQCLTYTEPLVAYLQSGKHQNTCHVAGFCALCAMQKHVNSALQSTGRILAPKDLVSNLRRISRTFRSARQEDAHEYMIQLLESMHRCCLPSGVPAESPGAYDKSLVHKIFGGRLRSQVKCLQCSHCSNTFDPFLDLSLEIMKADSVHKALVNFTAAEHLDGGERQYKCEKCKQKVRALKQLTVSKAPYVLTIHLKRFRHFSGQKIDKKVHFGSSLNLKPFVSGAYEGDLTYTLYGVLVHAGWSTHSGHYYCFVRTSSGIWYSLDDNRVYEVSERKVMDQKAYMLFYVRDRKNVGPKKAMDVVHKENLITNMQNASSQCSIPGVKSFQNGYVDKNSKEAIPSALVMKQSEGHNASEVLVEQKTSRCVSTNAITLEEELNQKTNNTKSSASFVSKENSTTTNTGLDETVQPATKCSNVAHSEESAKARVSSIFLKNNREKHIASLEKRSISNCPSNVAIVSCSKDSLVAGTPAGTEVHNSLSNDASDGKGIIPSESAIQLTTEDVRTTKDGTSKLASDIHSVLSKPRVKKPCKSSLVQSPESTPHQRLMKEILKSRVGGTHLSTKMLYGASLSLRKRKRFKRVKKRSKNVVQEQLLNEDCVPADMGPSTSDSDSVGNFKRSRKKGYNACDVGEKLGANCKNVNDSCSKEPNSELVNGGFVATTTRGLEESAVGRWDGAESSLKKVESNGRDTLTIGHVLDEWDEEYDQGKRKKVRGLRNSFGGPNVFQEIATKKAKVKVDAISIV